MSSVAGARPWLVRILEARDSSPHLTNLIAAFFRCSIPDVIGNWSFEDL